MRAMRPKVLLVSENLGTPSTYRKWHDYSVACLEALKVAGAEVTLVVERAFGFEGGAKPAAIDAESRLTALYEYLRVGGFRPRLFYSGAVARLLAQRAPAILRALATRQHRRALACESPFDNHSQDVSGLPERLEYLRDVDRFLYPPRFYSASQLRAVYDTGPVELDATGYDLVVIDGLLPIRITRADPARIATIVHDVAAVTAPDTRIKARMITGRGLAEIAERRGTLLFATQDARARFDKLAGSVEGRVELVLGPVMPARLRRSSAPPTAAEETGFVSTQRAKARRAAFLRAVSPAGILRRLVRELAGGSGEDSGLTGDDPTDLPVVALVSAAGDQSEIGLVAALAAELSGLARLFVLGLGPPPPPGNSASVRPVELPDNLELAGELPERDRVDVLRHAALVVYPERSGAGSKPLEAAALGRPIVVVDTPANRELLDDADATFVPLPHRSMAGAILARLEAIETGRDTDTSRAAWQLSADRIAEHFRMLLERGRG